MSGFSFLNNRGQNPFESQSGYASPIADYQRDVTIPNILNDYAKTRGAGTRLTPGASPFSFGGGTTPGPGQSPKANPSDPFNLVKVSKDPTGRYDAANTNALDSIQNFKPDYGNVRDQIRGFLNSNNSTFASDSADLRTRTGDLVNNYDKNKGLMDKQTADQSGALDKFYLDDYDPNSVASKLRGQNTALTLAEKSQANRAAQQALLRSRLSGVGTGSSYANAQAADLAGSIAERAAIRSGERTRDDSRYVLDKQGALAGRSQDIETQNLLRSNIPVEAIKSMIDSQARQVSDRLRNAGQAVTIDQLTDELSTTGRKLGLTGQALQQYLAQNFLGVEKDGADYPLNIANYVPRRLASSPLPGPSYRGKGTSDVLDQSIYDRPKDRPAPAKVRTPAEEAYRKATGFYPEEDELFSPEMWNDLRSQYNGTHPGLAPGLNNTHNPLGPSSTIDGWTKYPYNPEYDDGADGIPLDNWDGYNA